jgi:cytochrome P450
MIAPTSTVASTAAPSAPKEAPNATGHWLLGMGPDILKRPLDMFTELGRLGDVVRFRLPAMPAVLVSHPDLVQRVFHDHKTYDKRMRSYQRLSPLLGNGLATSEGDFWLRQRRIAQPAFHRQRIAGYADLMVRLSEAACDAFLPRARRGEPFDFLSEMTRLTLAVMCEAMLGGDVPEETDVLARTAARRWRSSTASSTA